LGGPFLEVLDTLKNNPMVAGVILFFGVKESSFSRKNDFFLKKQYKIITLLFDNKMGLKKKNAYYPKIPNTSPPPW
jgi:hypothetical protein